ncbi:MULTISPECIES: ABC transporter substrate-binding protein [Ensifer]|jgi:glucose/mannose transport system substrate-binding protein|uniref:Probable sugar-binding periplasmic protein n=1 Tax=Ensifer canadensis TaxID=555315 RepID=A0AAW4FPW6_9HYPH|nr:MULTISPECIES: ABC transporter substrate-binding protein [Ensifer]AHK44614.1 putative sugar ABC transporter, substrate-binding protein [Ensifer adhaerens OV14]MDP9630779.1 glucose/mannose transport system substrate-binding protein [Ensifer adhaerens]KQU86143.1 ABC transporter substrate-binding protein [Ensifer sp. Root31]KQW58773.1 ABC transporter substrate-binding protein [Ensifer sp. Root1252]KQW74478.1 ABC transporter substrate-binding protein [Ensifer sp. Root127]
MNLRSFAAALAVTVALPFGAANATDLEVTHWWTSGGEAAAVAELAKAFDATGNHWVDGAIAGAGSTARPIMVSRLTGGDPMGATQFNHGRQAEELVEAGLMRDLTDVASKENWKEIIRPASLLDSCTIDGKVYCAPVNIHSWQWLWLSNAAFKKAGVDVPKNWDEFVAAAPALEKAGIVPLAVGGQPWQSAGAFDVLIVALAGKDTFLKVFGDKDEEVAAGPEIAKVFKAADDARRMSKGTNVQDWNQATNMVITGKAGGQIMGDWAQGEFQLAGQKAGTDYTCLPGLGVNEVIATGGDAFYFPVLKDEEKSKAQEVLASTLLNPATQVAFNLKKGSLPVRGDVDLAAANDCMKKGLDILAKGNVIQWTDQLLSADSQKQKEDLFSEFFANPSMTPEEAQKRFADIIASAD